MPYRHFAIGSTLTDGLLNCSDLSARMVGRKMSSNRYKYSLEARKAIYSRPLKEQFELVFKQGEAAVMKHIIKSSTAEDYGRVLDVAKAFAIDKQTTVYILPEINAREKILRGLLGLRTDNGYTKECSAMTLTIRRMSISILMGAYTKRPRDEALVFMGLQFRGLVSAVISPRIANIVTISITQIDSA